MFVNITPGFVNITPGFAPFGQDQIDFKQFYFAGGEYFINLKELREPLALSTHLLRSNITLTVQAKGHEFFKIPFVVDAIRRMGYDDEMSLFIPYFPGARDDRVCDPGQAMSCGVYAKIINSLYFDKVFIFDSHSDVAPALIDNCVPISNVEFVQKALAALAKNSQKIDTLIVPDAGASKKCKSIAHLFENVVQADKMRDLKTGKLTGFKIYGDLTNQNCLIVDDICDGGGTFVGLAEVALAHGAASLNLAVSHGIFSQGIKALHNFANVVTTDSWTDLKSKEADKSQCERTCLTVIPIQECCSDYL